MTDVADIGILLREAIAKNPTRSLTGHQLKMFVTAQHPDFNAGMYSCKNLREFIKRFVPDLLELGNAGMDVRYGLERPALPPASSVSETVPVTAIGVNSTVDDAQASAKAATHPSAPLHILLSNPRVWKTFASPTSPYRILLHDSTGQMRVLGTFDQAPGPDWKVVSPISGETLLAIAKEFVAGLPPDQQEPLTATLDAPKWWLPFFEVLQTIGLKTRWIMFRRRRIAEEFERAVSHTPVAGKTDGVTPALGPYGEPQQPEPPLLSVPKRVTLSAVQKMTDAELRLLHLPLGYILDALIEQVGADERGHDLRRRLL